MGADGAFCSFDSAIENVLRPLHAKLRAGEYHIQAEIDQYLVVCIDPAFRHLMLHKNAIPHYDNLPDISRLSTGILDSSLSGDPILIQMHLLLRQCTPLRRRTKRAQREVQWLAASIGMMKIVVRCMQGTLLGLYPTCTRPVAFKWRVLLFSFIRTLLVQSFSNLNICLSKIRYISKICLMEHICNTVVDYHPSLHHTLNTNGNQMSFFAQGVFTMCDIFRNEINTMFQAKNGHLLMTMEALDNVAHLLFERCTRSFRGVIVSPEALVNTGAAYTKLERSGNHTALFKLLHKIHVCPSHYVFKSIYEDIVPPQYMDYLWRLTHNIVVTQLPDCIRALQMQCLQKQFYMDAVLMKASCLVHLCVFCAMNKPIAHKKDTILQIRGNCKFRMHCDSMEIQCLACDMQSVVPINVLGHILRIGKSLYVLSCCCAKIIPYTGSGNEFSTVCGAHCMQSAAMPSAGWACGVCHQRSVHQTLTLLDIASRTVNPHHFCSRHVIPAHLCVNLLDTRELQIIQTQIGRSHTAMQRHASNKTKDQTKALKS